MPRKPDRIDALIDEILIDAYGHEEQLGAFVELISGRLPLGAGATVSGLPAALLEVEAVGWPLQPVMTYRRGGEKRRAPLLDVDAPGHAELKELLAAYRRWAGAEDAHPTAPARAETPWTYPLRTTPGGKRAAALVERLRSRPLRLQFVGMWQPDDEYWGEPEDEIDPVFEEIIDAGTRPECEMEQILPGAHLDELDDPITLSVGLKHEGYTKEARALLRSTLAQDQRCIDAHGHLGNLLFDGNPSAALVHYQTGVAIGELALPPDYPGLLPWGFIDNRPFLRSLHGMALSLWRLGLTAEADATFHTILWLNPPDQQGARFNLAAVRDGQPWRDDG